jgi:hypothetical protein
MEKALSSTKGKPWSQTDIQNLFVFDRILRGLGLSRLDAMIQFDFSPGFQSCDSIWVATSKLMYLLCLQYTLYFVRTGWTAVQQSAGTRACGVYTEAATLPNFDCQNVLIIPVLRIEEEL